jgi:hypothetical protein
MINQVLSNRIKPFHPECNFQFCAHPVDTGNEHGILYAREGCPVKGTERSDACYNILGKCRTKIAFDSLNNYFTRSDINASSFVRLRQLLPLVFFLTLM